MTHLPMMHRRRAARRPLAQRVMLIVLAGLWALSASAALAQGDSAVVLTIDGALTPAHAAYLERALVQVERRNPEVVILQLTTPGGEIELMNRLVGMIRGSPVPVVVYVWPRGGMAGSAGTMLTLAGHAAAMAPETTIGAASPVGGSGENLDSTIEAKLKEVMMAEVRNLAAHRPPEAIALAEATIQEARAATAVEAHAVGLVDFLADDVADLLRQLDGFTVMVDGEARTLSTAGLVIDPIPMNLLETALELLTNPNLVFLLLTVGTQAIIIELASPGGWVAGFFGAVCLALAFYGLGVLPVNWFGIIFIVLAFVLFIMEVYAPTHGALAAAGIGSLIVGALVLFNSPGSPDFLQVSVPLVIATSLVLAVAFVVVVTFAVRAQRQPAAVGVESLVGQVGEVRTPQSVQVAGELWSAEPAEGGPALEPGQRVEVAAVRGLKVLVRPKKP